MIFNIISPQAKERGFTYMAYHKNQGNEEGMDYLGCFDGIDGAGLCGVG